ncbi:hypothetical protein Phum_PHUM595830 [Pediculus humanus corporis]|uniref:Uncharacterized protein n=1 Tax=Pediculus humanus subsp. corporis TaxID=121224 RepID=E0W2M1_PEDHC|nr:uncharacterized protein Phum_PHUM595830 [Pediculus humanus corporis]EEB19877.1 hypothetical protein Phum_PHUM595830 [Pediculus humanus corporis]
MDSYFYRQLMNQINESCIIPHNCFPKHNLVVKDAHSHPLFEINENDLDVDDDIEHMGQVPYFKSFEYQTQLWHPLCCGGGTKNKSLNFVRKKLKWEKKLESLEMQNIKEELVSIRNLLNGDETKLSIDLINYIKHFKKDPEPEFNGNYNWLYTGGNLDVTQSNSGEIYLINAGYLESQNTFFVNKLQPDSFDMNYQLCHTLKKNLSILQISSRFKNEFLYILVRQKNLLNLFKVDSKLNEITKVWSKKKPSSESNVFTCCYISNDSRSIILSDSKCCVNIYDIETDKKKWKATKKSFVSKTPVMDKWNQVNLLENLIYFSNRNYFYTADIREPTNKLIIEYSPLNVVNDCENIVSMTDSKSNTNYYYYLSTNHNLIQIDLRKGKSVQMWTHMTKYPPQFINTVRTYDNNDLIILQSLNVNEIIGITNKMNGKNLELFSESLPRALTGPEKSLKMAKLNGLCLNPLFDTRFNFWVTGGKCFKNVKDDEIYLLVSNGGGDVFSSKISKTETENEKMINPGKFFLKKMKNFEIEMEKLWNGQSNVRKLKTIDLNYLLNDLTSDNVVIGKIKNKKKIKRDASWPKCEMFDEKCLIRHKDYLADKILNVWGLNWDDPDDGLSDSESFSDKKVKDWLDKMYVIKICLI